MPFQHVEGLLGHTAITNQYCRFLPFHAYVYERPDVDCRNEQKL
jgi:hypothetical protein